MKLIIAILIVTIACIHTKTRVYFRLLNYINKSSKDYIGECCDTWILGCHNECENWFQLCFKKGAAKSSKECLLNIKTFVLSDNDDSFSFPGNGKAIGSNIRNPIEFVYDGPFSGFGLYTQVYDDDSKNFLGIGKEDDLVDILYKDFEVKPGATKKDQVPMVTKFNGRRATITAQIWAYCETDWYNKDCNTYCVAKDDDITGHYTCDKKTGSKKCNKGWAGSNCNELNQLMRDLFAKLHLRVKSQQTRIESIERKQIIEAKELDLIQDEFKLTEKTAKQEKWL